MVLVRVCPSPLIFEWYSGRVCNILGCDQVWDLGAAFRLASSMCITSYGMGYGYDTTCTSLEATVGIRSCRTYGFTTLLNDPGRSVPL